MEAHRCNGALVVAGTEENALAIEIKGPLFDLAKVPEKDREDYVEAHRDRLESAFEDMLEQPATLLWDFEED